MSDKTINFGIMVQNLFDGWVDGTEGIDQRKSAQRLAELSEQALAEAYPNHIIESVVSYDLGGSTPHDLTTRYEGDKWHEEVYDIDAILEHVWDKFEWLVYDDQR